MLRHYLNIALRNLAQNKIYSLINILGLAVGISACLLITFYVIDELTFDEYHQDSERTFRIAYQNFGAHLDPVYVSTPEALQVVLKKDCPAFENIVRFTGGRDQVVQVTPKLLFFEQRNHFQVDPDFFSVFTIPFVHGSAQTAFSGPQSVLLSEKTAKKYFGVENPVGKNIQFSNKSWNVTGVFQEIPHNSHLPKFKIITLLKSEELNDWKWGMLSAKTYIKLKKNVAVEAASKQITQIVQRYRGDVLKKNGENPKYFLQPIQEIHLQSHFIRETGKPGNAKQITIFSIIALLILGIACLNFINLTTARSSSRAREVGVRKICGAHRSQLIRQFLGEAIIISLVAFVLSLFLIELTLPWFNSITEKQLALDSFTSFTFLAGLVGIFILVSVLSGAYPAFFLAAFQPTRTLKGDFLASGNSIWLRKTLITFQFTASIALIIGTVVIYSQINFMKNKDLGFHQEQMLVIPTQTPEMAKQLKTDFETIKTALLRHHSIVAATAQLNPPGRIQRESPLQVIDAKGEHEHLATWQFVDGNYLDTYNIPLVAGKGYPKTEGAASKVTVVINEAAVKAFGWSSPDEALGNRVKMWIFDGKIVGVAQDFHYWSLHHAINPLVLIKPPDMFPESITLRLNTPNVAETIAFLKTTWRKFFPNNPFEYFFIKSDFTKKYENDEQFGGVVLIFSSLAIFIAALGLFGLTALATEKRTKEIGIRKVLGASVPKIVVLISKEFVRLVVLANLIAWPIGYFAMNHWLQNFAYRTEVGWWIFLISGAVALGIALLTVSWQAIRAATVNPVESLKYE